METKINCAQACVNGCILGDKCPYVEYREAAVQFVDETPLDMMLEIAEESLRRRLAQPPNWVLPDEP